MKTFYETLMGRRTVRRFDRGKTIPDKSLERILKAASFAPTACNLQPIDYLVVESKEAREKLYPHLKLFSSKNPSLYIIALVNEELIEKSYQEVNFPKGILRDAYYISLGCAVSNLVNQAYAEGIASCIIGGIDSNAIKKDFDIDPKYSIPLVIALGYSEGYKVKPMLVAKDACTKPYRNQEGTVIVPKKKLEIKRK
ncbi:MAG: nitroreductase family protein [Nanoarchaeota archaeon]|nr:nitroreductase family protein [Nanoarchaeota archaeon]